MILLLSGEGPSDLGSCDYPHRSGWGDVFNPGPMSILLERLLEPGLGYCVCDLAREHDPKALHFIHEAELSRRAKIAKSKTILLPGLRSPVDTLYFYRNAQILGQIGLELRFQTNDSVLAVLFRDSDGTHSSPRTLWRDKVNSVVNGFESVEFDTGVPMIPKPKSEAWILCALKFPPYLHCDELEEASGNDNSLNSLKGQLDTVLQAVGEGVDLADRVREVEPLKISMPSFRHFYDILREAAGRTGIDLPPQD